MKGLRTRIRTLEELVTSRPLWRETKRYKVRVSTKTGLITGLWIKHATGQSFNLVNKHYGLGYNEYYDVATKRAYSQKYTNVSWQDYGNMLASSGVVRNRNRRKGKLWFKNVYLFNEESFVVEVFRRFTSNVVATDCSICFIFTRNPDWIDEYLFCDGIRISSSPCQRLTSEPSVDARRWAEVRGDKYGVRIAVEEVLGFGALRCSKPWLGFKEVEYEWFAHKSFREGEKQKLRVAVYPSRHY